MAIYALVLYTAGFLAPVFSGFINDGMGWEWVQVGEAVIVSGSTQLMTDSTGALSGLPSVLCFVSSSWRRLTTTDPRS